MSRAIQFIIDWLVHWLKNANINLFILSGCPQKINQLRIWLNSEKHKQLKFLFIDSRVSWVSSLDFRVGSVLSFKLQDKQTIYYWVKAIIYYYLFLLILFHKYVEIFVMNMSYKIIYNELTISIPIVWIKIIHLLITNHYKNDSIRNDLYRMTIAIIVGKNLNLRTFQNHGFKIMKYVSTIVWLKSIDLDDSPSVICNDVWWKYINV